jgi:hypothetical protein
MKKDEIKRYTQGLIYISMATGASVCIALYGFLHVNILSGIAATAVAGYGINSILYGYNKIMSRLK